MTERRKAILLCIRDGLMAEIYAARFAREGWEVTTVDALRGIETQAVNHRPSVILLDVDLTTDVAAELERLRRLPTLQRAKLVLFAPTADSPTIARAMAAGADGFILARHIVPAGAVKEVRRLLEV